MLVTLLLGSVVYCFTSLAFFTQWDESHINHQQTAQIEYANNVYSDINLSALNDTPYTENKEISHTYNIKYNIHNKRTGLYGLSYTHQTYHNKDTFFDTNQSYTTQKLHSSHNIIKLHSTYKGFKPIYGIKPTVSLNLGYLDINTRDFKFNQATNSIPERIIHTQKGYGIIDTHLTFFWKGYFLDGFKKPILFCTLGLTSKQSDIYKYIQVGGTYYIFNQLSIKGSFGSYPTYVRSNHNVSQIKATVGYHF